MVQPPSYHSMDIARMDSEENFELEFTGQTVSYEKIPLEKGDRVFFDTIEGDFIGTVTSVETPNNIVMVEVALDCDPTSPIKFHRALFRKFTILDRISEI